MSPHEHEPAAADERHLLHNGHLDPNSALEANGHFGSNDNTRSRGYGTIQPDEVLTSIPTDEATTSLPPVDRGWDAWLFLAACFVLEGVVWGLPFSFGVFEVYYSHHEPFMSQNASIAAIGSTATGVSYFSSPLFGIAMQRWPSTRRPAMFCGLAIMVLGIVGASFTNSVIGLIATQGVLYAVGSILLYFPGTLFLDEWFVARKGMAFGIMWAGTGTAGTAIPFILQWLLDAYGFRIALRIWAVVMVALTIPTLFFVKPRLPMSAASALRPQGLAFMKHRPFWVFQFGNIAQSLGVFLPPIWMPSFALLIDLPRHAGPLSVALYNAGFSVGAIYLGWVADKYHVSQAILISTVGSLVAVLVFWGLAMSQAMLYIFAILWGVFGGGFNATWPGCAREMRRLEPGGNVDTGIVIGMMAAGKGIGGVVSGPLSEKLLGIDWHSHSGFAYGTPYGVLIIFCGISAAFGGAACLGRVFKLV